MSIPRTRLAAAAAAVALSVLGLAAVAPAADAAREAAPVTKAAPPPWPTYHGNRVRSGVGSMPTAVGSPTITHKITLDGAVYASPIVYNGTTIVATENNTVYAFDAGFHVLWKRHIGAPSPASERPCGNIDPLGITGTPIYASLTNAVYVAAELGNPVRHRLYSIDFRTGQVNWWHGLDLPGVDPVVMQERGALTISGSRVLTPFGGLSGDCGNYKGRVISIDRTGGGQRLSYTVPTAREAGIWTPPGPTVDGAGNAYVSVGNGASGVGDPYDHSDSVLELASPNLTLKSYFSPSTWQNDNDSDLDLGSLGPSLIAGTYVLAIGKSGYGYLLKANALGGIGGQLTSTRVCIGAYGGTAVVGRVVYVPCADGLKALTITSTPRIATNWTAPSSSINGSPVVGGGRVWSLAPSNGILYGLSRTDGHVLSQTSVGTTSRFATPSIYGKVMVVPTLSGITVISTS